MSSSVMNIFAIVAVAPASTMIEPSIPLSSPAPKSIVEFAPAETISGDLSRINSPKSKLARTMVSPLWACVMACRRSVSPATGVSVKFVTGIVLI
jgi:hypothetical protein